MPPPSSHGSQVLPSKELALFKKIIKCYEQKQYKIGLRCAKQILSNPQFAEHGETLAMKGLILNCMGKHDEAIEIVKRGLKADLKSHVCWHVYGLVERSDKKYDEAMKAYKMALRIESDNLQILRDLALLQIQMRDLEGYRDSRYKLLVLRPSNKLSWIAYANACHLIGDYDMALHVIKEFRKNNRPNQHPDFENSELTLYEIMILKEAGRLEHALTRLEENASQILDKTAYMERRAELLMELKRFEDAEKVYWLLVDRNSDNKFYYEQLEKCRGLDRDSSPHDKYKIYEKAIQKHPMASVPKVKSLFLFDGEAFEKHLLPYLINGLRKGVPSLFQTLVPLYAYPTKVNVLDSILMNFVRRIDKNGYSQFSLDDSELPESPTTVLWVYFYVAQHYDCLKQYAKALTYVEKALQHTPTLIELLMLKAKIQKHSGNLSEAAQIMIQAQELDTADRYVNSKCAKYMLRAGLIKEAEEMCSKFTREGVNASECLTDMQCMWYEIECAKAYANKCDFGEALKKLHQIERHFQCFYEDQYDFHTYCIRKMTLCSYVQILRSEDMLRKHPYYVKAAKLAAQIYVRMIDSPDDFKEKSSEGAENMSEAEIRKMKRKANKAKALEAAEKKAQQSARKKPEDATDVVDSEPLDPQKLLKTDKPLDEAARFVQPFINLPCDDAEAYLIAFEVYYRKKKFLVMLQCLKKAHSLNPNHPNWNAAISKYLTLFKATEFSGLPGELVTELTQELLKNKTPS